MHLAGSHVLEKSPEELFERLQDPQVLVKCIPGCEELARGPDGAFEVRLQAGFGPIKGSFTGRVVLKDLAPPRSYTMELQGEGKVGFLNGTTRIRLEPLDGGKRTEVHYESDVQVGGLLATVGARPNIAFIVDLGPLPAV